MDNMGETIAQHFDPEQAARIQVILGRQLALANLVDMLWTNELAKSDDPLQEAEELKRKILSLLDFDPGDPVQQEAVDETERRLDAILRRVRSLDTPPPHPRI